MAANTLAAYRRDLAAYAAFLRHRGTADAASLTEADVDAYVDHLKSALDEDGRPRWSAASVARAVVAVRSFHRFCLTEGHLAVDPSEDVTAPRVPQGIPKALTEPEVEALLGAVTGDDPTARRDRAILETLYGTGLRISELVGLDLGAVDLEDGFLRAFGKGAKERIVPVGHTAAAAIEAWLPARAAVLARARRDRADADALFINPRGGRLTRQGCWKIVAGYGLRGGPGRAALAPRPAPLLRHPHGRPRRRPPRRPGAPRSRQCLDHADLHEGHADPAAGRVRRGAPPGEAANFDGAASPLGGSFGLDCPVMADVTNATQRAQLEEERARIRGQLEQMGHFGTGLSFDEGFADSGQVTAERGEVEALANSLVETLTEVEHALEKFDRGTYGTCENCGAEIPEARLEAKPAARLCINCASARR